MRKIAEIRNDISAKVEELKGIDRTNVEAMEKATSELKALMTELNAANEVEAAEQRAAAAKLEDIQKKEGRQFSFLKFIREASEGNLTGIEAEAAEIGAEEYRRLGLSQTGVVVPACLLRAQGQNYTTDADGGYLKETMASRYTEILKKRLVVAQMGATVLTDLVGTLPVISSAQIAAAWGAEGANVSATTKAAFARATMTPHRNVIQTAFTKDLLRQTSFDVENFLLDLMGQAHANLIEDAAINGDGQNNKPTGILANCTSNNNNLVAMGASGGSISWQKIVELETVVAAQDAIRGSLGYITNAKVQGDLKTTERTSTNGRYLLDGDFKQLNGYKFDYTSFVPSNLTKGSGSSAVSNLSAMIFGNFADLWIGEWGGIDVVVDPYTRAGYGEVLLTFNAWNDVLVTNTKSFAAIKDIKTNA